MTNTHHTPRRCAVMAWLTGTLYFKFLLFDLIWAIPTTFSAFQFPLGWLLKLVLSCVLAMPLLLIRRKWYVVAICLCVDAWLAANLMYFRTYYTVIPLSSYLIAGNLADFKSSVVDAMRWSDLLFPLTTAGLLFVLWDTDVKKILSADFTRLWHRMLLWTGAPALAALILIWCNGGYKAAYEKTMYDYSMVISSVYTIPGTWLYSIIVGEPELTPEVKAKIENWMAGKPDAGALPYQIRPRQNCIIILCESLESWVLEKTVDGIELTPRLNKLLSGDSVLYAPNVLTQVRDARSIDAQLLIHAGVMPVSYGAYSYRFPHHEYMTLDKAWKEKYPDGKSISFTVDKGTVWNAAIVAQDFGYDRLLEKRDWVLDEKTGPRGRLGDESFLRQAYQKIKNPELWPESGHTLLQCVTYSGHTPFVLPEELQHIRYDGDSPYPDALKRYMVTANYTDRAIGAFIDSLRTSPKFRNTMIVITGDHEGIGINRQEYLKTPGVADFLSPGQFTPFIVLNSPVAMRYGGVMGQIDLYPTLLDLLGLEQYAWRGQGTSILRPNKKPYAVTPRRQVVGCDTVPADELSHAHKAYDIGDLIISTNYFKHR